MKTITLTILALLLLSACASQPEAVAPIKIGIIAATTGPVAYIGTPEMQGALLAVKELNSAGSNIELIVEDSPCDPPKAVTAFKKLAEVDKVDYIIGPSCSFENMAVAPIAEDMKIPVIALGAQEELANVGAFTIPFSALPSDQGEKLADYLTAQGYRKAGAIYFSGPYTKQIAEGLKKGFLENNGEFMLNEELSDFSKTDFRDVALKAMDKGIDAVYIEPFGQEATVIRQFTELGYKGKIVFGENGYRKDVAEIPAAESLVVVTYQALTNGKYDEFHTSFVKEYGEPGQPFNAAMAYDAVKLIYQLKDIPKEQLKETIISNGNSGASGTLQYQNGQPHRDFLIYRIVSNKFVPENSSGRGAV